MKQARSFLMASSRIDAEVYARLWIIQDGRDSPFQSLFRSKHF